MMCIANLLFFFPPPLAFFTDLKCTASSSDADPIEHLSRLPDMNLKTKVSQECFPLKIAV